MLNDWARSLIGSDIAAFGMVACSVSFALIGMRLQTQRHYLWLAGGTLLLATWWGASRWLPPGGYHASREFLFAYLIIALAGCVLWNGLLHHYLPGHRTARRRLVAVLVAVNLTAAAVALAALLRGSQVPRLPLIAAINWQVFPVVFAGLIAARKEPKTGHALSSVALLLIPLSGFYQVIVDGPSMVMRHIAMILFLAMSIAILPAAFIREHRRLAGEVLARRDAERSLTALNGELQATSEAMKSALWAAEAGERTRTRFLALVGHEIRTPLTGLAGHLDLLAREPNPPPVQALVDGAVVSLVDLQRLLNNLLIVSRMGPDAERAEPTLTDLAGVLHARLSLWRARAADKGLAFTTSLEALPTRLHVDVERLLVVIDELLANGVKFTEQGGIRFSAEFTGGERPRLAIRVQDSGIGVPADRVAAIFVPFEQGESSKIDARQHDGSGLGLSVALYLVRCLGGRLAYAAAAGGGSVLSFDIPVALGPVDEPSVSASPRDHTVPVVSIPAGVLQRKRILVVDDNAVVRKMLVAMLHKLGVDPVPTSDAVSALALLEQGPFSAVLMDISMPGMSGLEGTRLIRQREAAQAGTSVPVPIIGISAHTMPGDRETCEAAGMSAYLPKPITLQQLRRSLEDTVG